MDPFTIQISTGGGTRSNPRGTGVALLFFLSGLDAFRSHGARDERDEFFLWTSRFPGIDCARSLTTWCWTWGKPRATARSKNSEGLACRRRQAALAATQDSRAPDVAARDVESVKEDG